MSRSSGLLALDIMPRALLLVACFVAGCGAEVPVLWTENNDAGLARDGGMRDGGFDAGHDAGSDAASDAGADAGPPPGPIVVRADGGLDDRVWAFYGTSRDAEHTAFATPAGNLVAGDENGVADIFVFERRTGEVERITMGVAGEPDDHSRFASISADGRYVAFTSAATNLVPGDTNGLSDVFVHDRLTHTTRRVMGVGGAEPDGEPSAARIAAGGGQVVYTSTATNLVVGDTNAAQDVFLTDLDTGLTVRISESGTGEQADDGADYPSPSADGRWVAFESRATNLVPDDRNGVTDVFLWNRDTRALERVSIADDEREANSGSIGGVVSDDGSRVSFRSFASNLVVADANSQWDFFVRDRAVPATLRASLADGGGELNDSTIHGVLSDDGSRIAFSTIATNAVPGDDNEVGEIFVHDLPTQRTLRIEGPMGPVNAQAHMPILAPGGRWVVFRSLADNLVPDDVDGTWDLFVAPIP